MEVESKYRGYHLTLMIKQPQERKSHPAEAHKLGCHGNTSIGGAHKNLVTFRDSQLLDFELA